MSRLPQPPRPLTWLYPFAAWLPWVTRAELRADLLAALTGAIQHFFGVHMDSGGHVHDILIRFGGHAAEINPFATAVAVVTLVVGILIRRLLPVIPYMLAAMLAGGLTAVGLDAIVGPDVTQIATVGALPASLPPLSAPALTLDHIRALAPAALAVTLFALTEAVSIGRALGARGATASTVTRSSSVRGCRTSRAPSSPAMWPRAPSTAAPSTMRPVPAHRWQRCLPGCC